MNFNTKNFIDGVKGDEGVKKSLKAEAEDQVPMIRITGATIGKYAAKLETLVRNVKSWMDSTKKSYNNSKKAIDEMMKQAKQLTNINHRSVRAYCSACRKLSHFLTKYVLPDPQQPVINTA